MLCKKYDLTQSDTHSLLLVVLLLASPSKDNIKFFYRMICIMYLLWIKI